MFRTKWWIYALSITLPAALVVAVLWGSLASGLTWDDKFLMSNPAYLRMGLSPYTIFSPVLTNTAAFWRPIGMLAMAPQFTLVPSPAKAHMVGLILYALFCAVASWSILALFTRIHTKTDIAISNTNSTLILHRTAVAALVVGCWLAVNPSANQASYWISNRFHLVGGLSLLSTFVVASWLHRRRFDRLALSCMTLGFALCALSSEAGIAWAIWGVMLCVSMGGFGAKGSSWALILATLAAALAWARLAFLGSIIPTAPGVSLWDGALSDLAEASLAQAVPWFSGVPGAPLLMTRSPLLFCMGLFIWLAIAVIALRRMRSSKASGFLLAGWVVSCAAQALFTRSIAAYGYSSVLGGEYVLGSAALVISIAMLVLEISSDSKKQSIGKPALAGLLLCLASILAAGSYHSRSLLADWSSDLTLWMKSLESYPANPLATSNEMVALSKSGQTKDAIDLGEAYWILMEGQPELNRMQLSALVTYISLLEANGETDVAAGKAERLMPKASKDPRVALLAGNLFVKQKKWAEAIASANFSLSKFNREWEGKRLAAALEELLARSYYGMGKLDEAEKHYLTSVKLLDLKLAK